MHQSNVPPPPGTSVVVLRKPIEQIFCPMGCRGFGQCLTTYIRYIVILYLLYVDEQLPNGVGHFLCFETSQMSIPICSGGEVGGYVWLVHNTLPTSATCDIIRDFLISLFITHFILCSVWIQLHVMMRDEDWRDDDCFLQLSFTLCQWTTLKIASKELKNQPSTYAFSVCWIIYIISWELFEFLE